MKLRVYGTYHSSCRKCGHKSGNLVLEEEEELRNASTWYIECPKCHKRTVHALNGDMPYRAWNSGYIFSVDEEGCPVYANGERINQGTWWC